MSILKIKIYNRTETGKNENNRLRKDGKVPVNIISNGKSTPGAVIASEINKVLDSGIRPASLITVEMEGESATSQVFVKEIQRFPATNEVRHIDFYRVTPGRKIKAKIGIQTTGQAKGSKSGGQFVHLIHEISVKSIPEDLKDLLILDVTNLEIGQSIKVSELPVPKAGKYSSMVTPLLLLLIKPKQSLRLKEMRS
jgi:large subunit ribosomal protein L25